MNKKLLGAALFAVAALLAVGVSLLGSGGGSDPITGLIRSARPAPLHVMGYSGSEKMGLLENPAVRKHLADTAGITLDSRKAGSLEMVTTAAILEQKPDFLWPSGSAAVEIAAERGLPVLRREVVFTSPIVLYSWAPIAEALAGQGLARPVSDSRFAYWLDAPALLERAAAGTTWAELGMPALYGSMTVVPTDPARSNSGAQFAALATVLLGGGSDAAGFERGAGRVRGLLARAGYLEHSSGVLFDQYLRNGMGDKPLIAGYESQIIEFARERPELWKRVLEQPVHPVILYPEPTMFSSHEMLALTEAGRTMIDAMLDPAVRCVAWTGHGFRAGLAGGDCALEPPVKGLPDQVTRVVPMIPAAAVERLLEVLKRP